MLTYNHGQKIKANPDMGRASISKECDDYGTNSRLIKMLLEGRVLTVIDESERGVRVKEYTESTPWIPKSVIKIHGGILEEGEEL